MPRPVRVLLAFLLLALPLGVLGGAGAVTALRQLDRSREAAVDQTVGTVAAALTDAGATLRREAITLARDPALVEGTAKGDWATMVRWASPRLLTVTRDGMADLLVLRDARGAPLVQVPAVPPPALPELPAVTEPRVTLALMGGRPYLLAMAPIASSSASEEASRIPAGVIVLGRRFEAIARGIDTLPSRPAVVLVTGDLALAVTRPGVPAAGWAEATRTGRLGTDGETFAVRALDLRELGASAGSLWALVPDTEFQLVRRQLWLWLVSLGAAAAVLLAVGAWLLSRRTCRPRSAREPGADDARGPAALERRNHELEALNAIAVMIGRGGGIVATAEEALEVVRGVARIDVGVVYRLDPEADRLVMVAQRGLDEEEVAYVRERPLEGTNVGRAARSGRVHVVYLHDSPPTDARLAEMAARRGHRSQVSLPIVVEGRCWGVMVVVSPESRDFTAEELSTLEAVSRQVGLAVERAQLQEMAAARLDRLEAQRVIERHILEQLDLERLLALVASSALRLIGGDFSVVYLRDGDVLRPRAWSGAVGEWIRDVQIPVGTGIVGTAAADGQGVVVNDYSRSPLALTTFREMTARLLAQPLAAGGRVPGVMVISRQRGSPAFVEENLSTLADFASQAVVALENARLFADAKRSAAEYLALFEVGRLVSSTLDVDRVLDVIVERCCALMGVTAAGIFTVDGTGGDLTYARGVGLSPEFVASLRIRMGEGTTGRAMRDREPVWTRDLLSDPRITLSEETRTLVRREGYRSVLSAPILSKGEVHGAVVAYWWEAHEPTKSELALIEALAGQAAIALENARLYQAATDRGQRLATLARLTESLTATLSLDDVLSRVVDGAVGLYGASVAGLWLMNADGRSLSLRAQAGGPSPLSGPSAVTVGEGLIGSIVKTRSPLVVPGRADAVIGFAGIPLALGNRVLGVLSVALGDARPFSEEDLNLLQSLANHAATAIENARLYAETKRGLEESRALLEVADILNSTLDPKQLLKRVAIKIAQVCGVDRCSIERWDGDRVIPLMSQFADGHRDERLWQIFSTMPGYAPREVPAHALAIETRRPVIISDATTTDLIPREWIETFEQKSFLAVPLIRQDTVLGLMTLDHTRRVTPFEPWQVDLATAIAKQIALSIENARLYGEAQERLQETSTLLAVGRALSEPGPSVESMRRVAREVALAFGADMAGVFMLDPAKKVIRPVAGYHVPKHLIEMFQGRPLRVEHFPALEQTWAERRAIWSSDIRSDPRFDQASFEGVEPMSVLLAPTPVRGQAVGALCLVWWRPGREFAPAEVRLVEGVAAQVALALENTELAHQTQRKLEETESLLSVSRTLGSTLDLQALPRHLLRHVVRTLDADAAGLWMLDESEQWLEPVSGYRVPARMLEGVRRLRFAIDEHPLYAEAARTGRPVISSDVMHDPRIPQALREAAPHRVQLFVPIIAKGRMVGGFAVVWWTTGRELSEDELRIMEAIVSQAGLGLENARLFRDNQRRVKELSVLHELSRAVTGQLDEAGLLETIEQQMARLLDVRHMVILLYDEDRDELDVALRVKDGVRHQIGPRRYRRRAAGLAGVILDTGRAIRTDDYLGECARRGVQPVPESVDIPSWLGVPMTTADRIMGVLALRSRERGFTESDERLLANIADLTALALRSARLYEERARAHAELAAAQDQLIRTEKLRAMGEMASGVAHDFNNVLASIVGRAQLLLGRVEDPKLRQWIQVIERAAMDGARTVRQLQDFTRVRRDHPVVAVDLNQVIQHTLEATEPSWRQEPRSRGVEIEVTTSLSVPLPRVAGDPADLREALTNLILNALDAMPEGGRLRLASDVVGGRVEVTVSDSGVGIAENIRHKIFDPFFTTKGPKGTGLGLSMTYGILSRHGARVTVESEEGRGATFRLSFPIAEGVEESTGAAVSKPAAATPLRCLVVDDEEAVADVLGDILMSAGHKAAVVTSGALAVDRLRSEPFDVVLTDLAMPGMTGWEVARAVKAVAPTVRVLLVSGFGVEVSTADMRAHGVDMVLAKPIRYEDLIGALASLRLVADG